MLIIYWDYKTDTTTHELSKAHADKYQWVINELIDKDVRAIIHTNATCTCEVQAIPESLKQYQAKVDYNFAYGKRGLLLNVPGVRVELPEREVFLISEDDAIENDILTQFIR